MTYSRKIFSLTLICLISVFSAAGQKNDKKDKSSLTPVDVKANLLITDDKNYAINDIKQEDIKIFEDGVEQKITYFARKEPVLNLALVVDNTGSMRTKLDEIIFAASVIVSNLRPSDEAMIVRFVGSSKITVEQEWSSDQNKLDNTLQNMFIEGGQSAVLDAIYLAQQELLKREKENKNKRYAILLISDVEELDSYYKYDEVLKTFQNSDSQIFILSYADDAQKERKKAFFLGHKLSLETGGTIHNLAKKHSREELVEVLKKLVLELRSNYVVGYTSSNQKHDGLERKLTVEVAGSTDGGKRNVIMRNVFTVPLEK